MTETELRARFRADFLRFCRDIAHPPWLEMEEAIIAALGKATERKDDAAWIYQLGSSIAGADLAIAAQKAGDDARCARMVEAGAVLWRLVLALQNERA